MKRNQIFALGTLAGVAGTSLLTAGASSGTPSALSAAGKSASFPTSSVGSVSTGTSVAKVKVRSVLGDSVFVNFGYVQLKVTAKGKKITDIKAIKSPNRDGYSRMVASQSLPILRREAINMQSANISSVSGASYTSAGFKQSLQSALNKLGI